jgi:hypothetical protein
MVMPSPPFHIDRAAPDHSSGAASRQLATWLTGRRALLAASGLAALARPSTPAQAQGLPLIGPIEAVRIALDAYIFGYPLVTFDTVRLQQTNVAEAGPERAPMGQIIRMRSYPAVDNHCCAAPNADTLYTEAWLDVAREPWIIGIPAMGERYYILPFLDGWSNVFHVASTPTTGGGAQSYAICGPGWAGTLPDGVTRLDSPTGMVWMLGRIYCTGTPEDYAAVHALQDRFTLTPLSAQGRPWTPPRATVDPAFDMTTAVRKQVNDLDINTYLRRLAALMKANPPRAADAPMVARMAQIGLVPGQDFDKSQLGFVDDEVIRVVPKLALAEMALHLRRQPTTNGWLFFTSGVGDFGTDYLKRAMCNLLGPGWNRPQDAVYPLSQKDADGHDYDSASKRYVIRFERGQLPPARAFWSLTMYDTDFFFVPNPANRYAVSQRDRLVAGPDGAVEILMQADRPAGRESNWLPAPRGKFNLVMRLYWPSATPPSILDGSWTPPAVRAA